MEVNKEFNDIMNDPNLSIPDKINKALTYKPERIVGLNFLEAHPNLSKSLKLDNEHVIVDREDWDNTIYYLLKNRITPNNIEECQSINV